MTRGSDPAVGDIVVDGASIQRRIRELGAQIDASYASAERPVVLVCVLKGSILFTADLSRSISVPVEYEFVACRSYGPGATSSGVVELVKDVGMSLRGRDVLMVEDIVDTGLTTAFLFEHLEYHRPRSLRLVALLNKVQRRQKDITIDFTGFDIPNRFVVGYGLDLAERYRNLPDVRAVDGL